MGFDGELDELDKLQKSRKFEICVYLVDRTCTMSIEDIANSKLIESRSIGIF